MKPTRGVSSTSRRRPRRAARSTVSRFSRPTIAGAARVFDVAAASDSTRPVLRERADSGAPRRRTFRFGYRGPTSAASSATTTRARNFEGSKRLQRPAASPVEIDFAPFCDAAELLYDGPFVAERTAAVGDFVAAHPDEVCSR